MGSIVALLAWLVAAAEPRLLTDLEAEQPVSLVGEGVQPGCRAEPSDEQAHSGRRSIKLTYDFIADPPALQYCGWRVPLQIPRAGWLRFQVYGDDSGQTVALRLSDPSGEVHQWRLGRVDYRGWREVAARIDRGGEESWSGDGDRRLQWPATFDSILVDSTARPGRGAIYFDSLTTQYADAQVPPLNVPLALPAPARTPLAGIDSPPADQLIVTAVGDGAEHGLRVTVTGADGREQAVEWGPERWIGPLVAGLDLTGVTAPGARWRLALEAVGGGPLTVAEAVVAPRRAAPQPANLRVEACDGPPPGLAGTLVHPASKLTAETDDPAQGEGCWRLDYQFGLTEPMEYLEIPTPAGIGRAPTSIRARLRGDRSGHAVRCRLVDGSGEYFQYDLGPLEFGGWAELTADLTTDDGHWGGDGNGRWDGELRLVSVLLDSSAEAAAGSIALDDLRVETAVRPADLLDAELTFDQPGGIYRANPPREVSLALRWLADGPPPADAGLTLIVRDGSGEVLERRPIEVTPGGTARELPLPADAPPGFYQLDLLLSAGGDARLLSRSYCVLPAMPATNLETNLFGACFHYAQGKGQLPLSLDLLAAAGGRWVRDEYSWATVEPRRGEYRFPAYHDAYFRAYRERGLEPLMILDYGNPNYDEGNAPTSDEAQQAFAEYCRQMVARYKDVCRYWEIYNEPNIGFWRPEPDPVAYARLLKLGYEAIKEADPNAVVVGVCTAGVDLAYIEAVLKEGAGPFMDALSVHPYRYPRSPEESGFVDELDRCHALMERYGIGDKPLWLTEIGWPNQDDGRGVTEAVTARYLIRMLVLARTRAYVGPVFWYDFQNDGTNPAYNEDNFGLIRLDYTPKRPYLAAAMMNRALASRAFERSLELGDGVHAYVFAGGDERTLVLWSTVGERTVELDLGGALAELSDGTGRLETVPLADGRLTVALNAEPLFVGGRFERPVARRVE